MNKTALFALSLIASTVCTGNALAQGTKFGGPIEVKAVVTKSGQGLANTPTTKTVTVMDLNLTPEQKKHFTTYPKKSFAPKTNYTLAGGSRLPAQVDLGMNGTPVLNQGRHGSCVTFATAGALDALIGQGDYVSELCSLELGNTLQNVSYKLSGWMGAFGPDIVQQMVTFGVVDKATQFEKSCAGVTEYPVADGANTGKAISLEEYKSLSHDLTQKISWYSLLSNFERYQWSYDNDKAANKLLNNVKKTLATRTRDNDDVRLTFGIALVVNHCFSGACGTYHQKNDTWTLTDAIRYDTDPTIGGHEMVITGYNDDAVVTDNEGKKHKGVLIIRNSWGNDVGNRGTFYITYDYFKQFVWEVQAIVSTHTPIV